MTREEIRLQVAISVIQGVLEAKHGVIGEVVPSVAVAIALRIADAFVEEWYRETKEQPEEPAKWSDDERIRKDIRLVIESAATRYFKETGNMPQWYNRIVSYLEKQKEQKTVELSEEDKEAVDQLVEEYIEGVKKLTDTPTWDLIRIAVYHGYELGLKAKKL